MEEVVEKNPDQEGQTCIFCEIVNKEIPASVVYEDENVLSFLDIMPANKGHALIIPKKHYEFLHDIPDEELGDIMKVVKKIAKALSLSIGNGAYNIVMNNGKESGQVVPHAHIHIVPRFSGDGLRLNWSPGKYKDKEIDEVRENIKKFL